MKVYSATTPPEAHIICGLLKTHRIACEVRGEGIFGLQGEVPFGEDSAPYVWLLDVEKEEAARALILHHNRDVPGPDWCCTSCGEHNESQFALCWQCGSQAPSQEHGGE